jgi:glycosyltransferase involved in cell wall biosynthesis
MDKETPEFSIVVPVYNSENTLEKLFSSIQNVMNEMGKTFEIIFVEDYSSDNSWQVLQKIHQANTEQVKIIRFAKNYGQHNATLCGFRHCSGNYVVTIDDDLQHQPQDIPTLVAEIESSKADIVYAICETPHKGFRKWGSKGWKTGTKIFDEALGEGSSFRLIRRDVVKKVAEHRQHFVFIDEMLYWYTEHIQVVNVEFNAGEKNSSGYSSFKLVMMGLNLAVFYSSLPLRLMTYGGLLLSFFTFCLGVFYISKKLIWGAPVPGYTSLIVAILFSTSIMLICFGIIGQYLGKIYTVLNNKPTYSIREKEL